MPKAKKAKNKAKQKPVTKPLLCSICAKPIGPGVDVVPTGKRKVAHDTCQAVKDESERVIDGCKKYGLTIKEYIFCKLMASPGPCLGNQTRAYCDAYSLDHTDIQQNAVARTMGSRLFSKVDIKRCIGDLLELDMTERLANNIMHVGMMNFEEPQVQVAWTTLYFKLHGLLIDRTKVTTMTHEQMLDELRKLHEGAAQ